MRHKRNSSPLAKLRLRVNLDQGEVADAIGVGGGKVVLSQYETGRLLLPVEHIPALAALYRVSQRRMAWAASETFRKGLTMERFRTIRKKGVDYTSESA